MNLSHLKWWMRQLKRSTRKPNSSPGRFDPWVRAWRSGRIVKPADYIDFGEIPHWPRSTVMGHKGRLVIGELESKPVMIMQGRVHFYEGYPMPMIGFPIRVMVRMGIEVLIVTNAAGAVNPAYEPGQCHVDHRSFVLAGNGWAESTDGSEY